jgi:hypothetical protein
MGEVEGGGIVRFVRLVTEDGVTGLEGEEELAE